MLLVVIGWLLLLLRIYYKNIVDYFSKSYDNFFLWEEKFIIT